MQAALGIPLTVYGTGGQTRAFIHIKDTARCIEIAVMNPPEAGGAVRILNQVLWQFYAIQLRFTSYFGQVAETQRVRDLAKMVAGLSGVEVRFLANPRSEDKENELEVSNKNFRSLGYEPTFLDGGLLDEVVNIAGEVVCMQ
jgi:UDP-sulfoquinovose synthase